MSEYLSDRWTDTLYLVDHLEPQHGCMLLAAVVFIGWLVLRGLGSRAHQ